MNNEDIQVFGAIGPFQMQEKNHLVFISAYILIAGMIGLVGLEFMELKIRKKISLDNYPFFQDHLMASSKFSLFFNNAC